MNKKQIWHTPKEALAFFPHLRSTEAEAIREWIREGKLKAKMVGPKPKGKQGRRYLIHRREIDKLIKNA